MNYEDSILDDIDTVLTDTTLGIGDRLNEAERLRAALTEIACYNDEGAEKRLRERGTYSAFDEPSSVAIARAALETPTLPAPAFTIAAIREKLFDVIDDGWQVEDIGMKLAWLFWHDESDEQTEMRMRFVDEICRRLNG